MNVLLIVASLGCLSYSVQNDVQYTQSLMLEGMFLHSSTEDGKFFFDHLKSEFKTCTYEQD